MCMVCMILRLYIPASLQMFDNISKLQFVQGPGGESIANAMISSEGEMMEYRKGVPAEGKVCKYTYNSKLCITSLGIHTPMVSYYVEVFISNKIGPKP